MTNRAKCRDINAAVLAMILLGVWTHAGAQTSVGAQKPQARDCAALTATHLENAQIFSAEEVPEGTVVAPFGPQTAHCLVKGEVNKHTGADGVEYGDRFELRLPDAWTGRLLFQGGGGLDGMINPALGAMAVGSGEKDALSRGYAVASTDGGHQGKSPMDASFGSDPEALADYQYRSTDRVRDGVEENRHPILRTLAAALLHGGLLQWRPRSDDCVAALSQRFRRHCRRRPRLPPHTSSNRRGVGHSAICRDCSQR